MQFSIRAVLALTLLTGGMCGLMFGVPEEYLAYALMVPWMVLPGALVSTLVYGRGYLRAFAIGSLPIAIPSAICALTLAASAGSLDTDDATNLRIVSVSGAAIVVLSGATSAAIRWVLSPQRTIRAAITQPIAITDHTASGPIFSGRIAAAGEPHEPHGPSGRRAASAVEQSLAAGSHGANEEQS